MRGENENMEAKDRGMNAHYSTLS